MVGGPENVKRDEDFEKQTRHRENKGGSAGGGDDQVRKNIDKIKAETSEKARKTLG